jgi:hypothetical protein
MTELAVAGKTGVSTRLSKARAATSGATADTCAQASLRAGAAHVDVLVFARVVALVRTPI